jgi:glucose/arabinose dehydrogenase
MILKSKRSRLTEQVRRSLVAVLTLSAAVLFWACAGGSATAVSPSASISSGYNVSRYVKGANQAVAMTFDNKGRLLYNEKDSGRIIRYSNGHKSVLATLGVAGGGESGLLGLTVDNNGEVYAYYTGSESNCPDPTTTPADSGLNAHCVWAFKPTSSGRLKPDHLVFSADHPSSAQNHVGGGLHIGPEGDLYMTIGDLGENDDPNKGPGRSQNLSLPFGKMLRLDPAGTNKPASGNPGQCGNVDNTAQRKADDERIFACGLRNTFAFAFDANNRIWGSEAGDSCDEINLVKAGVNYGWQPPRTDCSGSGAGKPVLKITGTPSGITVPTSKSAGSWRGDVFYCVFNSAQLMRFDPRTHKVAPLSKAQGKCTYNLASRGSYIYMSSADTIYRIKIK